MFESLDSVVFWLVGFVFALLCNSGSNVQWLLVSLAFVCYYCKGVILRQQCLVILKVKFGFCVLACEF